MFKLLKSWILPKEIDFFGSLSNQSIATGNVIDELVSFYLTHTTEKSASIFVLIDDANKKRKLNIIELNSTFITPVDKEAISRAYNNLHWIVLSVKHLLVETNTYKVYNLEQYQLIFEILQKEMNELSLAFSLLNGKQYDKILHHVNKGIHYDDGLIKEYANELEQLFDGTDLKYILEHKEVLSQIKEISKRIHYCSNILEDIVFKLN